MLKDRRKLNNKKLNFKKLWKEIYKFNKNNLCIRLNNWKDYMKERLH